MAIAFADDAQHVQGLMPRSMLLWPWPEEVMFLTVSQTLRKRVSIKKVSPVAVFSGYMYDM